MARKTIEGLYAVTPDLQDSGALRHAVVAALRGGVRLVQYRNKKADAMLRAQQARDLAKACRRFGACLIINDDPELAAQCGAGGVHLGADDAPVERARRILGPAAVIGVSCYSSLERAARAAAQGADYVAFGSFFGSATKPGAAPAPLSLLKEAHAVVQLPIVAIGGISAQNAPTVIEAGADAVAMVSALFGTADIEAQARRLLQIVAAGLSRRAAAQAA